MREIGDIIVDFLATNPTREQADLVRQALDWAFGRTPGRKLPESEWAILSYLIYRRDGRSCQYCGESYGPLCIDHVFPLSRGGSNDPDNLTVACVSCNSSKRDKTVSEWRGRE